MRSCWPNTAPMPSGRDRPGMPSRALLLSSWIRPPRTTVWPLRTCSSDSISRTWMMGMEFLTPAFSRSGLGSSTDPTLREMVGRTVSDTMPFSLICGSTDITTPMGTVCAVVVKVAGWSTEPVEDNAPCCDCTEKYTRLSTTLSSAVWLFSAMSLGLDSTLVLPNDSSRSMAAVKPLLPVLVYVAWMKGESAPASALVPPPTVLIVQPVAPCRAFDQSMPARYWSLSVTSTMVASISTWRWAYCMTRSRYCCTSSSCLEVPRTVTVPATGLTATSYLPSPAGWLANAAVNRLAAPAPALLAASACETRSARSAFSASSRAARSSLLWVTARVPASSVRMLSASTVHRSLFDWLETVVVEELPAVAPAEPLPLLRLPTPVLAISAATPTREAAWRATFT